MQPSKAQEYILEALDGGTFAAVYRTCLYRNRRMGFTTALLMRLMRDLVSGKAKHMDTIALVSTTHNSTTSLFSSLIMLHGAGMHGASFVSIPFTEGCRNCSIGVSAFVTVHVVALSVSELNSFRGRKIDLVYADVTAKWFREILPLVFGAKIIRAVITQTSFGTNADALDRFGSHLEVSSFDNLKRKIC
jgi:hypothetical protein